MEQKRRLIRLSTTIKAEYSLKGSGGGACRVINISPGEAGLDCYSSEPIDVGATIVLKIFD